MRRLLALAACAAALSSSACGGRDPVAEEADTAEALPDAETLPPDEMTGTGDAEGNAAAPPTPAAPPVTIPAALHGRWGLAPTDCTAPGAARGLLVVTADGLRFYESVARLARHNGSSSDSISGDFAFTGEGQTWTRYQTLQLRDDKLIRTETRPTASYTYARCD